jgi:hypothetical protein
VLYLDGQLAPRKAERLEGHLAGCAECRELLSQVRAGRDVARELGRIGTEVGKPPSFEELWARAGVEPDRSSRRTGSWRAVLPGFTAPVAVRVFVLIALAGSVLLVMFNREPSRRAGEGAWAVSKAGDFTPLSIADFSSNANGRIVTEGIVRGVYFDKEEKTLHIKLVEARHKSEPFVICEVLNPAAMAIPREGSLVRVYGTARFDSQPGRGWNEVNPVSNIDVLKR